jgi:hypothetical protein
VHDRFDTGNFVRSRLGLPSTQERKVSTAHTRAGTVVTAVASSLLLAGCSASTPAASTKPVTSAAPVSGSSVSAAPVGSAATVSAPSVSAATVSASPATTSATVAAGLPAPVDAPETDGTYAVEGEKFDAPVWFAKAKAEGKPFVGIVNYGTYKSEGAAGEESSDNLCIIFLIAGSLKVISTNEVVKPITVNIVPGDAMFTTDGCKPWVRVS